MSKTPKLRFKEFSGDWETIKLGDITVKTGIKNKDNEEYDVYSISNKYGFIPQEEQFENSRLSGLDKSLYQIVGKGEFAYNPARINVGSIGVLEEDKNVIVSSLYVCFKFIEGMDYRLFKTYFDTYKFNKDVIRNTEGSVREYLFYENFSRIKMNIPKIEEQEKIASFFSLIDEKISLQSEKVEALKDYKRGMMQKIFSRELRFKDDEGRDYLEWEEKKLNQLGDTYTGLSGKTKENFGIGEGKYVIYKNVFGNTIAKEDEVELVEINEGESQNKVIKGDLLFTTSSETPNEVGMISCWNYDVDNLYLNSFCFGYRLFDLEKYSPIFMAYLLRSDFYRRKISILGQGSTRYNISKNELMKMKIKVPVIEEQRKIVSLLLGIESKIEKEQEKLDSLNEYKKGLLQQMFV